MSEKELKLVPYNPIIDFSVKNSKNEELLKICDDGRFYVNGKIVENDREVYLALKEFLNIECPMRQKLWAVITALKSERDHFKDCTYKECDECNELMTLTDNALSEVDNNA